MENKKNNIKPKEESFNTPNQDALSFDNFKMDRENSIKNIESEKIYIYTFLFSHKF